jgi:hypothetical protein
VGTVFAITIFPIRNIEMNILGSIRAMQLI